MQKTPLATLVFIAAALSGSVDAAPANAPWAYSSKIDPFTDQKISTAIGHGRGIALYARCKDQQIEVYAALDAFIGGELTQVRLRTDKNDAKTTQWTVSTDDTAVFAPDDEIEGLMSDLSSGSSLLIEVLDYRDVAHTFTVPLSGANGAISKIKADCSAWLSKRSIAKAAPPPAAAPSTPPQRDEGPVVWIAQPTPAQIANTYPTRAQEAQRGGSATLNCDVHPDGRVYDCRLISEDPRGENFGAAALKLFHYYKAAPWTGSDRQAQITLTFVPAPERF